MRELLLMLVGGGIALVVAWIGIVIWWFTKGWKDWR